MFKVGDRVTVYDRYNLALPCIGTITKISNENDGGVCVMFEKGSYGKAEERFSTGHWVHQFQLRSINTVKTEYCGKHQINFYGKDTCPMCHKSTITSNFETQREQYIEYLLMNVERRDWHAVSDAANDLRVLEAKNGL